MLFTTPGEWIALALALLGGLLLGLALHPGGRKWQARYLTERDAHAAARRDHEARLTASDTRLRDHETRLAAADARTRELEVGHARLGQSDARVAELERERDAHAAELARSREAVSLAQARTSELERENARLTEAARTKPVAAQPVAMSAPPATGPGTETTTRRVMSGDRSKRAWFDWGPGSDPRAAPRS